MFAGYLRTAAHPYSGSSSRKVEVLKAFVLAFHFLYGVFSRGCFASSLPFLLFVCPWNGVFPCVGVVISWRGFFRCVCSIISYSISKAPVIFFFYLQKMSHTISKLFAPPQKCVQFYINRRVITSVGNQRGNMSKKSDETTAASATRSISELPGHDRTCVRTASRSRVQPD